MLLLFIFFFGTFIAIFVVLSISLANYHVRIFPVREVQVASQPSSLPPQIDGLPSVPHTIAQVRTSMDDKQFEYFSAALVIALGEGHRFVSRVGGAGDWGIDVRLINQYSLPVLVQAKFYEPGSNVTPEMVRDFFGTLSLQKAVYGFFVTTSDFSKQAHQTIEASRGRIRPIAGWQIERMLRYRTREIALAMRDIQDSIDAE